MESPQNLTVGEGKEGRGIEEKGVGVGQGGQVAGIERRKESSKHMRIPSLDPVPSVEGIGKGRGGRRCHVPCGSCSSGEKVIFLWM